MKKTVMILSALAFIAGSLQAQEILIKDLDGDGITDTVRIKESKIDDENSLARFICLLSSHRFEEIKSQPINIPHFANTVVEVGVTSTKSGFEIFTNEAFMGFREQKAQFRFDRQTGKMQLIGMTNASSGNAEGDDKGKSSVNLLTGDYIGDWYLLEPNLEKLVKIPTIKAKMNFGKIYFEDFINTLFKYEKECNELRYEQQRKVIEANIEKYYKE